jgi:hypothetical protein
VIPSGSGLIGRNGIGDLSYGIFSRAQQTNHVSCGLLYRRPNDFTVAVDKGLMCVLAKYGELPIRGTKNEEA